MRFRRISIILKLRRFFNLNSKNYHVKMLWDLKKNGNFAA